MRRREQARSFPAVASCYGAPLLLMATAKGQRLTDTLELEVHDLEIPVLTGIYSEETHLPQPLRISVSAGLECGAHFAPGTPLSASKNYLDLKRCATEFPPGLHFTLIEAVADHIIAQVLAGDARVQWVRVKIVKLAIAEAGESIGMTLFRRRMPG